MSPIELTLAFAGVLLIAFALGWAAHWGLARMSRAAAPRADRADELASELLLVEAARDRAEAEAEAREAALTRKAAEMERRLLSQLREREAELSAAMEGLRAARRVAGPEGDA